MGMCKWFCKDATKIQNGRQRSTSKLFVGAKTLKLLSQKLVKFYYHIPRDMEMSRWLFQGFTEIQNGRHISTSIFLWAQKLKKLKTEIIWTYLQVIFLRF